VSQVYNCPKSRWGTAPTGNAITGVPRTDIDTSVLQTCPRRIEDGRIPGSPFVGSDSVDVWGKDRTCSYCGSLHPDDFIAALESGERLVPTDKNYKAYLGDHKKFYYQHLSEDQKRRFIELCNNKQINFGEPGYL